MLFRSNKTCPIKNISINQVRAQWLTPDHLEQIKLKDDLLAEARSTRDRETWIAAQKCRNLTKKMMKHAKSEFLTTALAESRHDSKRFWRTLKKVLPKGDSKHPINLVGEDGTPIAPGLAAVTINNFFTTVATELDVYTDEWQNPGLVTDSQFKIEQPTMSELKKEIGKINILKSSGIDHISSRVLKDAFGATPQILLHIMNLSIAFSKFPRKWKTATIIPIEKKPNPPSPSDFRPISLLPLPGKLLEKLISKQMTEYLETQDLFVDGQDGFRKERSTIKSVSTLTDDEIGRAHV